MPPSCQDGDRAGWHHAIARFTPPPQSRGNSFTVPVAARGVLEAEAVAHADDPHVFHPGHAPGVGAHQYRDAGPGPGGYLGRRPAASFLCHGTRSLFEQAGFSYIRPTGTKNCVMRIVIPQAG